MKKDQLNKLREDIDNLSNVFPPVTLATIVQEDKAKDTETTASPKLFLGMIDKLDGVKNKLCELCVYAILERVCVEDNKFYIFDKPYQSGMSYDAVTKVEGTYYLRDEDGDLGETLISEKFMRYLDEMYWELYEAK